MSVAGAARDYFLSFSFSFFFFFLSAIDTFGLFVVPFLICPLAMMVPPRRQLSPDRACHASLMCTIELYVLKALLYLFIGYLLRQTGYCRLAFLAWARVSGDGAGGLFA